MTHIWGPVTWTKAVFLRAHKDLSTDPPQLVVELEAGRRLMNSDWTGFDVTEEKVLRLTLGSHIEYATWSSFDPQKWFCDVRCV
jgi:hypothetical protein